MSQYQTTNK